VTTTTTSPADSMASREPGTDAPLLEVTDLVTHYPVRRGLAWAAARHPRRVVHAVDGVSFSLNRGEMMALVGESGCGRPARCRPSSAWSGTPAARSG